MHSSVVDEFINFYYEKVRENLSTLTDPNIFIDGLGTFSLRKIKIKKAIIKNKSYLGNLEKTTYNGYNKTILIEAEAKIRWDVCKQCELLDIKGSECAVPGTQPCCGDCGCSLSIKMRSLASSCPKDKWPAYLTEDEELDLLKQLEDGED